MNMKRKLGSLSALTGVGLIGFLAGCPMGPGLPGSCPGVPCGAGETCVDGTCVASQPAGFSSANVTRGGSLYDKFWKVEGVTAAEPTDDHPLWASRPDKESNTRTGSDTWRCKECHGWDYKGVDGVYSSGSHRTGIGGIFNTTLSAQEVFDLIKTDHAYGSAGLTDEDIWDLAKFVLEGQIDTDTIIDANGMFTGDVNAGETLYNSGIGTNIACMVCHGADGLTIEFEPGEFVGTVASDNPWEFQHKVRFGNPGAPMPAAVDVNASNDDIANVGAFAQTLPTAAP